MVVLSLFDGISCGQLALQRIGIKPDKYYASEIEPSTIKITQANFPNTIQIGDVSHINYDEENKMLITENGNFPLSDVDLFIGGSPCTDFSSIGYSKGIIFKNAEITSLETYLSLKNSGAVFSGQSYLFWEYVRLLKEIKPKYFLLENVKMAKKWEDMISEELGISPLKINSSLVSAQNRPRLYWTNIPNASIPKDRKITLDDIIDTSIKGDDVSYCKTVIKSLDLLQNKYGYIPERFNAYNFTKKTDKACALTSGSMITSSCATLIFAKSKNGVHTIKKGILNNKYNSHLSDGRYNIRALTLNEMEKLQTLPEGYTNIEGVTERKKSIAIGNGWTVDVIAHIFKDLVNEYN